MSPQQLHKFPLAAKQESGKKRKYLSGELLHAQSQGPTEGDPVTAITFNNDHYQHKVFSDNNRQHATGCGSKVIKF